MARPLHSGPMCTAATPDTDGMLPGAFFDVPTNHGWTTDHPRLPRIRLRLECVTLRLAATRRRHGPGNRFMGRQALRRRQAGNWRGGCEVDSLTHREDARKQPLATAAQRRTVLPKDATSSWSTGHGEAQSHPARGTGGAARKRAGRTAGKHRRRTQASGEGTGRHFGNGGAYVMQPRSLRRDGSSSGAAAAHWNGCSRRHL